MSSTKLRKRPIAEQIAHYEKEIENIKIRISNSRARIKELERHIRRLQKPDAEEKYQKRMAQFNRQQDMKRQREEQFARNRARIERDIEECLRINGKIA